MNVLEMCAQAVERGYGLRDEVRVLMIHGFLHLMGYDHETGPDDMVSHL